MNSAVTGRDDADLSSRPSLREMYELAALTRHQREHWGVLHLGVHRNTGQLFSSPFCCVSEIIPYPISKTNELMLLNQLQPGTTLHHFSSSEVQFVRPFFYLVTVARMYDWTTTDGDGVLEKVNPLLVLFL